MVRAIMCQGQCTREYDDYCGMYMPGEECPACKTEREKKERETK